MTSKFTITFLYALAFTVWPPDRGVSQIKEVPDSIGYKFDSAVIFDKENAKIEFKQAVGTTKVIQREAIRNLERLEKRKKPIRIDTFIVYVPVYDSVLNDTPKHKKSLFKRLFK